LCTIFPRAHATANADGRCRGHIAEVKTFGIDGAIRVACFAAQPDGKQLAGGIELPWGVTNSPRDPQVISSIWHLCQLPGDNSGLRNGFVDIPARAGTAGVRTVSARDRLSL